MERNRETAQSPLEAGCCGSVAGKSMLPSLWPGDRVWIERVDPGTLHIGDVILFELHSCYCVHRIQDIRTGNDGARVFVTRGDARPRTDPEVAADQILGKVVSVVRGEREISKVSERALWNRGVGAALARFEPMASLASRLIDEKMTWKKRRDFGQRSPR
jgi:signal peptidase I